MLFRDFSSFGFGFLIFMCIGFVVVGGRVEGEGVRSFVV